MGWLLIVIWWYGAVRCGVMYMGYYHMEAQKPTRIQTHESAFSLAHKKLNT